MSDIRDHDENPMHCIQFGSGVVWSEPVAGNPVKWTWRRLRIALFGYRARVITKMELTEVSVVYPDAGGKMRFGLGAGGKILESRMEWQKPDWMRRIAASFKRAWARLERQMTGKCQSCGTVLVFGDNIYEDMVEHWYCPNEKCPESDLYIGRDGARG